MYEAYWELSEPPFDNSPNPKFFYLSPEHEEALVRLVYTVRHRKGCGMLIGEYGCGKTTLSRALIQRLEAERYEIGLLTNPSWNSVDFLREALYQLGVESKEKGKSELLHQLNEVFFRNFREGRDTVLIVDEAQLIGDLVVVVRVESDLDVEVLGTVDIGHRNRDELELHVHQSGYLLHGT